MATICGFCGKVASLCLSVCLALYLYLFLSVWLYLYLSVWLSIFIYIYLSLSINLCVYVCILSVCLSGSISIYIYLSIYQSVCIYITCIHIYIYLSIYIHIYPCTTYPSQYVIDIQYIYSISLLFLSCVANWTFYHHFPVGFVDTARQKFGLLLKKAGKEGKCWSCLKAACASCAPSYDGRVGSPCDRPDTEPPNLCVCVCVCVWVCMRV
jgi:hypothetical protein